MQGSMDATRGFMDAMRGSKDSTQGSKDAKRGFMAGIHRFVDTLQVFFGCPRFFLEGGGAFFLLGG